MNESERISERRERLKDSAFLVEFNKKNYTKKYSNEEYFPHKKKSDKYVEDLIK